MTFFTEEEAKTKWCPLTRGPGAVNVTLDRQTDTEVRPGCIASACMAWRTANIGYTKNGYCGAFSRPELESLP